MKNYIHSSDLVRIMNNKFIKQRFINKLINYINLGTELTLVFGIIYFLYHIIKYIIK